MSFNDVDLAWMRQALNLAEQAQDVGEVPVGAVIVQDSELIGTGYNQPIINHDPSAHAEIQALRSACSAVKNYRIPNSTIYVTLEPCAMCAGAIVHARVARVVIAAKEPRAGAAGSILNVLQHPDLNHRCQVEFGLLEQHSADLLRGFFRKRR